MRFAAQEPVMKHIFSRNTGRCTLHRPFLPHRFRFLFMALLFVCLFTTRHASASEFYQADITPLLDAAQSRCDQEGEYAALTYRGCTDAVRDMREKLQEQALYKNRDACMKAFASLLKRRDSLLRNQENWCIGQFANPHDRRGCLDAAQTLFSDFPGERYCLVPSGAIAPQNPIRAGYPLQTTGSSTPMSVINDTPKPGRYPGSSAGFTGRTPSGNEDSIAQELFAAPPGQTPVIDTPKPGRMPGAFRPAAKQRQSKSTSASANTRAAGAQKKPQHISKRPATDARMVLPAMQSAQTSGKKEQQGTASTQLKATQAQTASQPRTQADRVSETAGQDNRGILAPTSETTTPARAEGGAPSVEPMPMPHAGSLVQPSVKPDIRQPALIEAGKSPLANSPASEGLKAEPLQNTQKNTQTATEQHEQQEKNPAVALTASQQRKPETQNTGSSAVLNQRQVPPSDTEPNDGGDPVSALIGTIMKQEDATNEAAASGKEAENPLSPNPIAKSDFRPREKSVQKAQAQASGFGANAGATDDQQEDAPSFPAFTLPQPQQSQTAPVLQQSDTTHPRAQDGEPLPLPAGMLAVDHEMESASPEAPNVNASPPAR